MTVAGVGAAPTQEQAEEYRTVPLQALAYAGMVLGVSRLTGPSAASSRPRLRKYIEYGGGSGPDVITVPPTTEYLVSEAVVTGDVIVGDTLPWAWRLACH